MRVRTGKELLLATRPFAVDSTIKSWWHVWSTMLLLSGALAGTLANFHWIAKVVCSIASGLLLVRMFVIYHDQQHHAILPRSRVAEALMRIFGVFILSPSSIWRSSHNHHHHHNSKLRGAHIGSFPIMTRERFEKISGARRFKYLFMRHPLTILFGYVFIFLFGMCVYPFFNSPSKHYDSLIAFVLHIALATCVAIFLGAQALVLTILVPYFIATAIGCYLFYAQHNFPSVTFRDNAGWTYETAALTSSSYMQMNPFMAWVTANIGYHHVHHLNARIPFYRLPEVMKALPELQTAKTTSLHPVEIWRCLRLKVWDVAAQRMVSLGDKVPAVARGTKVPNTELGSRNKDSQVTPLQEADLSNRL
ncbi:MAG TPA: fatty acid desaturase [Methylomirabilota bacterium]|nr:fatty acid desaturase [Methylomirabilota bacterium]